MQFHTQLGVSTVTHITSLIALTFIEIHWVAMSCKYSLQLKNQVARLVGNHLNFS
jgi:hypothetical protein